jgi:hypothetical protein
VTIRSWKKKGFYELRVSYKHNNSSINYNDFSKNLKILQNFLISKTHMFVIDPLILIYWIHYKYYSGNFFWSLFKHRKIPSRISNIQCSEKYNNIFFLLTDTSFMYFFFFIKKNKGSSGKFLCLVKLERFKRTLTCNFLWCNKLDLQH